MRRAYKVAEKEIDLMFYSVFILIMNTLLFPLGLHKVGSWSQAELV